MEIKVQATQTQVREAFKKFIHKLNKQYGLSYLDMKIIIEEAAWWEQKYNTYPQLSADSKVYYKFKYTTSNPIGEKIDGKQQHTEGVCSGESSVPTQQCEQSQQASGSSDSF